MSIAIIVIISLVFADLMGVVVTAVAKGIRSGKTGPGAAKFFALIGTLVVGGIFVLLMGVLKNLQS